MNNKAFIFFAIVFFHSTCFAQDVISPAGGPQCSASTHPADVTTIAGSTVTFTANGNCQTFPAVTYQWQVSVDGGYNFINIPGALNYMSFGFSSYSFIAALSQNGNKYRCRVSIDTTLPILNGSYTLVATLGVVNSLISCPSNTFFKSGFNGSAYQWQVDTGAGFTNIVNNGVYTGSTSDSLSLTTIPGSYYGNKYRCAVSVPGNTSYSAVYKLILGMNWTGAINNEWENPANWACSSLPLSYTDVIIPAGLLHYPDVNLTTTVRSLKIDSAATINIRSGVQLHIYR